MPRPAPSRARRWDGRDHPRVRRPGAACPDLATAGGVPVIEIRYGYDLRGRVTSMTESRAVAQPVEHDVRVRRLRTARRRHGRRRGAGARRVRRGGQPRDGQDAGRHDRGRLRRPRSSGAIGAGVVHVPAGRPARRRPGGDRRDHLPVRRLRRPALRRAAGRPRSRISSTRPATGSGSRSTEARRGLPLSAGRPAGGSRPTPRAPSWPASGTTTQDGSRSLSEGASSYQVVTDHLGSPLLVIDAASGAVADAIAYDAWGAVTSESAPGFLPIGFAGGPAGHGHGPRQVRRPRVRPSNRSLDWSRPDPVCGWRPDPVSVRRRRPSQRNRPDRTRPWASTGGPGFPAFHRRAIGTTSTRTSRPAGAPCWGVSPPRRPSHRLRPRIRTRPGSGSSRDTRRSSSGGRAVSSAGRAAIWGPAGPGLCGGCVSGSVAAASRTSSTGDGVRFGFQGAGEYQMVASPDGSVVVQERMEPYGTSTLVTLGTAIAASVGGDRVAVYANDTTPLTINGKAQSRADLSHAPAPRGDGGAPRHDHDHHMAGRQPARRGQCREPPRLLLRPRSGHGADSCAGCSAAPTATLPMTSPRGMAP